MELGQDAFGRALMDWVHGGTDPEIYERDDGFLDIGAGPEIFLAAFRHWPGAERQAMRFARGRVLDVGCGAGRVPLYLQQRGFDVVGLDASPLAIKAARSCGVTQTWCAPLEDLAQDIGLFDTVVLYGNNFGIFGSPKRLHRVLKDWAAHTGPDVRILAESTNPYGGGAPFLDRRYSLRNKQRGLLPGQCRMRVRYGALATPWFDWMFVSRHDMGLLLRGTGWHLSRILGGTPRDPFVGIFEKD